MPARPRDTISFARGAPSLDIVDVEGLQRRRGARLRQRPRRARPPTEPRSATRALRSWIADHHGVEPERVLVTNGSMQADAFLFEYARARGRRGRSSSGPPTTARCSRCAARRARCTRSSSARRDRHRRAGLAARRRLAPEARPHHPQLPEPRRLHAVAGRSAHGCSSWPRSTGSSCSRTTPTSRCASAASRCRRCSRWTPSASSTPPRSRRPSARGSASATSSAPPS